MALMPPPLPAEASPCLMHTLSYTLCLFPSFRTALSEHGVRCA